MDAHTFYARISICAVKFDNVGGRGRYIEGG